jgi:hypothetical protein
VSLIWSILAPLLTWLVGAVREGKERAHEGVTVAEDPAAYDRLRSYQRL